MFNPNKTKTGLLKNYITSVIGLITFASYGNSLSAPASLNPSLINQDVINISPIDSGPLTRSINSGATLPLTTTSPMRITSVSPKTCVRKGGLITLSGYSFGTSAKKSLALTGNGLHIDLKTSQWSDKTITATIPNDSRLIAYKQYQVGVEVITHTKWLTALQYIRICATEEIQSITTQPVTAPTLQAAPVDNGPPAADEYSDWGNPEDDDYEFYEPTPSRLDHTNRMGSLIGSGQPPPKEAMQFRTTGNKQQSHEPDELIIVTVDMDDAIAIQQEFSAYGIRVKRRQKLANIGLVITTLGLATGTQADQILSEIRGQYPNLWVSLNTRYQLQSADNRKKVKKMVGWGKTTSQCGTNLRIGLIDTVIDVTHPAFSGQNILQKSLISRGVKPAETDHGSAIAGLLIGNHQTPANSGLLPGAKLIAANVFRKREDSVDTTAETLIRSLDWLVSQKVDAINMSLGGPENAILALAIENTLAKGIPVISSAGNGGNDSAPPFPAAQAGVIGVTAIDVRNKIFADATPGKHITFAAPGVDIWVSLAKQKGGYRSGTSYATPFVTAALLLAKQQQPDKNPLKILQANALDLGNKGRDEQFGWGLVKFNNACVQ